MTIVNPAAARTWFSSNTGARSSCPSSVSAVSRSPNASCMDPLRILRSAEPGAGGRRCQCGPSHSGARPLCTHRCPLAAWPRVRTALKEAPKPYRRGIAEDVGTFVLVFGGVGTAVIAGHLVGNLGVALAFGLSLLAM